MKRILLLTFLICTLCSSVFAASAESIYQDRIQKTPAKVGVVIIGSADVKTSDYFNAISSNLSSDNTKYTVEAGAIAQTEYQNYWADKDFLDEQPLTKSAAEAFVKYSKYDKVLFIIIKEPVIAKTERGGGIWGGKETVTRASIEVKVYLFDENGMVKSVNISRENNSATSDLRAKRGAFKKDMEEVGKEIKPVLLNSRY